MKKPIKTLYFLISSQFFLYFAIFSYIFSVAHILHMKHPAQSENRPAECELVWMSRTEPRHIMDIVLALSRINLPVKNYSISATCLAINHTNGFERIL